MPPGAGSALMSIEHRLYTGQCAQHMTYIMSFDPYKVGSIVDPFTDEKNWLHSECKCVVTEDHAFPP